MFPTLNTLPQIVVSHPEGAALPGWGIGLIVVTAASALIAFFFYRGLQAANVKLGQLQSKFDGLQEEHRGMREKGREQDKSLDTKRDKVKTLKRDLASQKKKNHALTEELKELKQQLKDEREERDKTASSRPAFSEEPKEKKAEAAPTTKKLPTANEKELQDKLAALEAKSSELQVQLKDAEKAHGETRGELKGLRRKVDDYRRVDVVTKGQLEILQDKVNHMGRKYYDAVSELAALKGEVVPPAPREAESTGSTAVAPKAPKNGTAEAAAEA